MSITVKQPEVHNIHALKNIWKICFGDTDEYINTFFEKGFKPEYALVALYDFKPVGMLYLLPALLEYKGKEYIGQYVYAVGVKPEYRKMGIMRALEEKATELAKASGLSFLTLIPKNESLYKMYSKLGYTASIYHNIRSHMPFKNAKTENIRLSKCSNTDFLNLRELHLKSMPSYVDFLSPFDKYRFDELAAAKSDITLADIDGVKHYFVGFKRSGIYLIKETSMNESELKRVMPLIANEYNVDVVSVRAFSKGVVDKIVPYAMYKSLDDAVTANDIKASRTFMNLMLD